MGSADLPSASTQRKGVSRKLLLLGTVVGALSLFSPAYAEVWDFSTPDVSGVTSQPYMGSEGTTVVASGHLTDAPPQNLLTSPGVGLGLAPNAELVPGEWIALDLSLVPNLHSTVLTFQAAGVAAGDSWEVFASDSATTFGTMLLGECSFAVSGNACNADTNLSAMPAGDTFLDVSAQSGSIVLSRIDSVPLPGAFLLFGTGLAGLGFVSRRRRSKKVSVL